VRSTLLLLLAACSAALLGAGCGRSNPVGVYTYSRAVAPPKFSPVQPEPPVTFILELRANGSYVSTFEAAVKGTPLNVEGDLPRGSGTWEVQDDSVVLANEEGVVGRLLLDGRDLISLNGGRYKRVRWLSDDPGDEPASDVLRAQP